MSRLLLLLILLLQATLAHAEPGNAPDTKGHFVLVVAGTATAAGSLGGNFLRDIQYQIQPVVIPGFGSFKLCVGAGKELQARLNTDGYALDFACIATGR